MSTQQSDVNTKVEDKEVLLENVELCGESPPPSYDELELHVRTAESIDARDSDTSQRSVRAFRKKPGPCVRLCFVLISLFIVMGIIALKSFRWNAYHIRDSNLRKIESKLPKYVSNLRDVTFKLQLLRAITCNQLPPLTVVEPWKGPEGAFVLRVDRSRIFLYVSEKSTNQDLHCCYNPTLPHPLRRSDSRSTCVFFEDKVFLKNEDIIEVMCRSPGSSSVSKIVYKNIHPVMARRIEDEGTLRMRAAPENAEHMNVLIFGFYVFSNSSIMTKLPKTVEFMRKAGFVEFENFRQVNLSKFSNDLALIKGQSLQSSNEHCSSEKNREEDKCILNPDEFIKANYVIDKVDYSMALTDQLDSILDDHSSCLQRKFTPDLFFRNVLRVTSRVNKYLYYSINWLNGIITSDFEDASFDSRTSQFLSELGESGMYNNTLVIFVTYTTPDIWVESGKLRNRPGNVRSSLFLGVPQWFQNKYRREMKNLWINRRKLVTPYDVFLTMKEISNKRSYYTTSNAVDTKYKSLLHPIENRSCKEAGISPSVCPSPYD